MQFFKLVLIFAAIALFVAACANKGATTDIDGKSNTIVANTNGNLTTAQISPVDEFAAAKVIYDQKCVKCHQETGAGGKIQIETVTLKVPNFRDPRNQDDDDEDYIERVEKGATGKMPAFKGKLTDDEIKSVVGFIRHEFQGKQN